VTIIGAGVKQKAMSGRTRARGQKARFQDTVDFARTISLHQTFPIPDFFQESVNRTLIQVALQCLDGDFDRPSESAFIDDAKSSFPQTTGAVNDDLGSVNQKL
jgi:hypothetical protein